MCSASKQADTNQVNIKYMDQTQKSVCVCVSNALTLNILNHN